MVGFGTPGIEGDQLHHDRDVPPHALLRGLERDVLVSFDAWCAEPAHDACRWLLWEAPGRTRLRDRLRGQARPDSVTLAIGPEGGFDAGEVDLAERHGFEVVSLGDRILRAESAALAALAIVQYEWGELG